MRRHRRPRAQQHGQGRPASRRIPQGTTQPRGRLHRHARQGEHTASHAAVADQLGKPLEPERWRGNIWLDGLPPWAEWDWIGRDIRIGAVTLRIQERIARCAHTAASPETGLRDADTLGALRDGWTHTDFGVYAAVMTGGRIALGDELEVL
ncbi:MOSC domain-containing protein [Loktanella salsilacus]|uniref:MOSC domain-containing protein n=1 Tax=Loktanella salsilacus TaxID=195913 RepID=UPI0035681988